MPPQEGNTALHYACLSNNSEVIVFLLRKAARAAAAAAALSRGSGAAVTPEVSVRYMLETRNDAAETPILRAAVAGNVGVTRALLVSRFVRGWVGGWVSKYWWWWW